MGYWGAVGLSVPMADLRPLLAETEPAWRANLTRLFDRMQFILGEQVAAFDGSSRRRWGRDSRSR